MQYTSYPLFVLLCVKTTEETDKTYQLTIFSPCGTDDSHRLFVAHRHKHHPAVLVITPALCVALYTPQPA